MNKHQVWESAKRILVILAHPDDPEFFCGATIAHWVEAGHDVHYCLLTTGQKGTQNPDLSTDQITKIRKHEQIEAANKLGVKSVEFFDYIDGELFPDLEMRKEIVRIIRKYRAQIVVTSDPQNLFPSDFRINHPDHRAAGQAVVDAIFPACGSPLYFPELVQDEQLEPVSIEELWLSSTAQPNLILDMTELFNKKIDAILCHHSQINISENDFVKMMRTRFEIDPQTQKPFYPEKYRCIKFN